jgi:hypothetical protein
MILIYQLLAIFNQINQNNSLFLFLNFKNSHYYYFIL